MVRRKTQPEPRAVVRVERVGLIGDVHTERTRLEAALRHLGAIRLDRVLCTGDLPDGPYDATAVDACCGLLRDAGVLTISGNHDRWLQDGELRDLDGATEREELAPESLAFLASLPPTFELSTPLGSVLLCHGMERDDMAGVQPFDHGLALENNAALQHVLKEHRFACVLAGHTHRPMVRAIDGLTIVNAGTLLSFQHPCCSLVDFAERFVQFYEIDEDGAVSLGQRFAL